MGDEYEKGKVEFIMDKKGFIVFTALTSYLKELGTNPAEYLSKEELKSYAEAGADYVGMTSEAFKEELWTVIKEMAGEHLG